MSEQAIRIRDQRRPGHYWADNEFLDHYGPLVGYAAIAVYNVFARHARNDSGECQLSLRDIGRAVDMGPSTASRAIQKLVDHGVLGIIKPGSSGPVFAASVYVLLEVKKQEPVPQRDRVEGGTCPTDEQPCPTMRQPCPTVGRYKEQDFKDYKTKSISPLGDEMVSDQIGEALNHCWQYYLEKLRRNPKTYTLTPKRRQKGIQRLKECLVKTGNNLRAAVEMMKRAIDQLAASVYHVDEGYVEWDENLFKSPEKLEWWLNRAPANGHGVLREKSAVEKLRSQGVGAGA